MKDYRVTVKVRNNRILRAIKEVGGSPGQKWCEAHGMSYGMVNGLINMTISPLLSDGSLRPDALRLCDVTNTIPDDLWSSAQLFPLERNFSDMEMDHEQVVALLPDEGQTYSLDTSEIEQEQRASIIWEILSTFPKNEQDVMRMRYYEDMTLRETGEVLGVSCERVRQIEMRVLRKLRNPSRADPLRVLLLDANSSA